jgi:hypothetical protein
MEVEFIKLDKNTQRYLISKYKKEFKLTWSDLGKKFGVTGPAMRNVFFRCKKYLTKQMYDELTKVLESSELERVRKNSKIVRDKWIRKKIKSRDNRSTVKTIKRKYGISFFKKIGKIGGKNQQFFWSLENRLKQVECGRRGGINRIKNQKLLNEKERILARENKKLKLIFKSNYFLTDDLNFDFVYFENNKVIGVEEVTLNPFRGLADFINKRERLNREIPFILTFEEITPEIVLFLLDNNIIPMELARRKDYIVKCLKDKSTREKFITMIKDETRMLLSDGIIYSKLCSINELKKPFNRYEKLVNDALQDSGFSPLGRKMIETRNGFYFVPDNFISLNKKKIAILVSSCNSRGSLLYTFYKHAAYALLFKNILKKPVQTFSIIFDFSGTATAQGSSKPRELWFKYCDFKLIINEGNINKLKENIKSALGL